MTLKHFAAAMLLAGMSMVANQATAQQTVAFGYVDNDEYLSWGTGKAETYNVAIYVGGEDLVGKKLTSIDVPVQINDKITDYSVWMTTRLRVNANKENVIDIHNAEVTPTDVANGFGKLQYALPEAYEIPAEGVYVGYSFKVNEVDGTAQLSYPVQVVEGVNENGFFLMTSRTYKKWADKSSLIKAISTLTVNIEGDFPVNGAKVAGIEDAYTKANEAGTALVSVANAGAAGVQSIEYTLVYDGESITKSQTFDPAIPNILNFMKVMTVDFPAKPQGFYDFSITIDKVNGVANEAADNTFEGTYSVFAELPVNNPLMEEFTGTWCGWCVRGWAAMEAMHQLHPEFIGIAYHNGDPMELANSSTFISQYADGFPSCTMNRTVNCDPYYGNSSSGFGIEVLWKQLKEPFNPFAIKVEAGWADDTHTAINANAAVTFLAESPASNYKVEYVLVGNNITGTGSGSWLQGNYYSGGGSGCPQYLEEFVTGQYSASSVAIPFNDVAVAVSGYKGIDGTVTTTTVGVANQSSHTFQTANIKNASGQAIPYVEDDLYVVAILLDCSSKTYGKVLNCAKAKVDGIVAGVRNVSVDAEAAIESVSYYDLSGRTVTNPGTGIYVRSVKYADGKVVNTKVAKR